MIVREIVQPGARHGPDEEVATRYGASVDEETMDGGVVYARVPRREPTGYCDGWLPD